MAFTININGTPHSIDVDGDTPLLWVLRDVLGMTGTKFGCGMALCGACTVHIDGVADPFLHHADRQHRQVRRSRRLKRSARRRPAQRSRKPGSTMKSSQCGYCQSGQIMSASALLASNPHPTDADIDDAMSGQYLPLRDLCPHPRGDQACRADECKGRLIMMLDRIASRSDRLRDLSRRSFLARALRVGGGLVLSLSLPFGRSEAAASETSRRTPSSGSAATARSS